MRASARWCAGVKITAGIAPPCDDGRMVDVGDDRREPDAQSATNAEPATESGPAIAQPAAAKPRLAPQVGPPRRRGVRPVFWIALVAAIVVPALGLSLVLQRGHADYERVHHGESHARSAPPATCNSLEVEQAIRNHEWDDIDRLTCLAVAGKIDRARALLRALPARTQAEAIARLFAVAHPIADRGDDASAGPIMKLVVEYWPQNFMAVFHAGMSDFALGRDDTAKPQLESFLRMYAPRDVWRARAENALAAIAAHAPLDQREAHFPE
jgi:hypothetical protein